MNFKIPDDAVDKALQDLVYNTIHDDFRRINWDPKTIVAKLEVTLRNSVNSDDLNISTTVWLTNRQTVSSVSSVSRISMLAANGGSDAARIISMGTQTAAKELVAGILKQYGTTFRDECERIYRREKERMNDPNYIPILPNPLVPEETVILTDGKNHVVGKFGKINELAEAIEKRKQDAKWKIE